jgi:hypothetical protein
MSRSWLVTCGILVLVLLPIPGYGNLYITAKDAEFEYIKSIPLPTGYEEYSWVSAGDMAYLRNTTIPRIDYAWTGYIWAFDAIVAMMLGVPAAVAVPAAAATASPWKEALSSLIVNGVEDLGLSWGVKEELLKNRHSTISRDYEKVKGRFLFPAAHRRGRRVLASSTSPMGLLRRPLLLSVFLLMHPSAPISLSICPRGGWQAPRKC